MGSKLEKAKKAVKELLDILKVERVYCVDDLYASKPSFETVMGGAASLSESTLQKIFDAGDTSFPEDIEVRRATIRKLWANVKDEEKWDRANAVLKAASAQNPGQANDRETADTLSEVIGAERLEKVAPSDWKSRWDGVKREVQEKGVLLLVDHDLSGDGESTEGGIMLIKSVLSDPEVGNVIRCGLLTNTTTIEAQHHKWVQLAAEKDINQDQFIVIAKRWLDEEPLGFARMLKLLALNSDCREMKNAAKSLLSDAMTEAAKSIDEIHVDDFDHMVFRASGAEGVWEPDMLFRLFGIYHRAESRKLAYMSTDLRQLTSKIRSVSHIPTDSETAPPLTSWQVQKKEMYDDGDYINAMNLPIENGDIFKKTDPDSNRYYILLAQPCDLMVRGFGKRQPEIKEFLLAEITDNDKEEKEDAVRLPYFGNDPNKKYFIRLRETHSVSACVLDLCVFNSDGSSKMDLDADCPSAIIPSWMKRFERLKSELTKIIKKYEGLVASLIPDESKRAKGLSQIVQQFPFSTSNTKTFAAKLDFGRKSISFNCQRVCRLHPSRAAAIAIRYGEYCSRPAFDRDLGKRIPDKEDAKDPEGSETGGAQPTRR